MKYLLVLSVLFASLVLSAQNPVGFDKMCNGYIKGTVPLATPRQMNRALGLKNTVILDARETKEYNISHVKGAILVGYNHFKMESVKGIDKNATIYVYCSVGYRSEKIGEKLQKSGFTKVYNIYGGIFNWANSGNELVDQNGNKTTKVHGYNNNWSQWLNEDKCSKVID